MNSLTFERANAPFLPMCRMPRRPLNLAVLAAIAALAQPAGAIEFTGLAPVYTASWFNGTFTEFHEFQYSLDWQGYCNAHIGSSCSSTTFWGVPFNWDANRLPTATDDVHTPVGSVVSIASYDSVYKGYIRGLAEAGSLTADGQISLGLDGLLRTDNGYISDLFMGGGSLETNGVVTINNLSQTLGTLQGSGTTKVMGISSPSWSNLLIKRGHTLEFYGQYGGIYGGSFGSTGPQLEAGTGDVFNPGIPGARLINYGTLDGAKVLLQGTANIATLPRLINRGTLTGGFNANGVRVDNEGTVSLDAGGLMYLGPAGTHSGSFTAGVNSVLTFGGPWGHKFLPGSSLSSAGKVVFQKGVHKVQGGFHAFETELLGAGGSVYLDFTGSSVHIDTLRVDAGSGELRFLTAEGVNLQELALGSGNVIFDTGTGAAKPLSTIQTLAMSGGTLTAHSPVNLANPFQWNVGNISGSGGVTALGGIEINATTALNRGLGGLLVNPGTANWHGGVINFFSGATFENQAGASFNILGDFSNGASNNGRFVNVGNVYKTTGSGVATLGMAFDNSGLVQAQAGTLRLSGGGTHDGGRFEALSGALIELSGDTVLKGNITTVGRVDITGGNLSLLAGSSYVNAVGNSVSVASLSNAGSFTSHGGLNVSGTLDNQGQFANHHPGASIGAVINAGTLTNLGNINVLGDVSNSGALTNMGGLTIAGNLVSTGSLRNDGAGSLMTVAGLSSSITGTFHNEGSLQFLGGDVTFGGTGSNLGQIVNGGGSFTVLAGASLGNDGTVTNDGGSFTVLAGASLGNDGTVMNDGGTVFVDTGGVLGGSGGYVQTYGETHIKGVLRADAGIDIQSGILRGGTPPGYTGPTAGTVIGNVNLGQTAQWKPGNSPGTFTVLGDVMVQGDATRAPGDGNIEIEFDSPTVHDHIVISGTLTLNEASVDLVFAPGFTALDGDSFEWLSAGQVVLPNGPGAVSFNVSGLSAGWEATPAFGTNGVSLEMINLLATPIPTSYSHTVAAGEQAYNWNWTVLYGLTVAGNLSNRAGGELWSGPLNIETGGRLLNLGSFRAGDVVVNAGTLINRGDGQFSYGSLFTNTGSLVNEGQFTGYGDIVNAAGGQFRNTGALTHGGQFINEAGGRFENRGSMTADGKIENRGEFIISGNLQNNASSLGPAYYTGSILNTEGGVFTVEAGGSVSGSGTYYQHVGDGLTRVNGTLAASDITILGGVLTGSGTLVGPVTLGSAWGSSVTVRPGNSPGTLTVDGSLDAYYTTFDIELAGPASYDQLVVTGDAQFTGGVVNFLLHTPDGLSYDYRPAPGDSFTWLTVGGAVDGLASLDWTLTVVGDGWQSTLAASYWGSTQWVWGPGPTDGVSIAFYGDRIEFTAPAVPIPPAAWLMLSGLSAMWFTARRRVRSADGPSQQG